MTRKPGLSATANLATETLKGTRGGFVSAILVGAAINILVLAGSIFTIQVYDRVLPARSLPTLVALMAMLLAVYLVQGLLEGVRSRIMARVGELVDARLMPLAARVVERQALTSTASGDGMQAVRDVDQLRGFLAGAGPVAVLDLPWVLLLVAVTFALHPLIGFVTVAGAIAMMGLLILTERASKAYNARSTEELARRNGAIEMLRRSSETAASMGLADRLKERFLTQHASLGACQLKLADITSSFGATGRVVRQGLQAMIITVGAYLVIEGQATAGIMFAASILTGRTLSPIEAAIAHWRQLQAARQSVARLDAVLVPAPVLPTEIPAPKSVIEVDDLVLAAPGARSALQAQVAFRLKAGEAMMVVGASGCGKSTLARALLGILPARGGSVRLDGATIDQWSAETFGGFTGYLPQVVELIDGTIAENIARFRANATPMAIVEAAMKAGVHEMIVGLPHGYDTRVGPNGMQLSGGQRQRVGLARALFDNPFLLVLDEPDAALDAAGEAALVKAIAAAKAAGSIVIVIAHRGSMLTVVDKMLALGQGRQIAFGPKRDVLDHLAAKTRPASAPAPMAQAS